MNNTLLQYVAEGYRHVAPEALYGRGSQLAEGIARSDGGYRAVTSEELFGSGSELVAATANEPYDASLVAEPLFQALVVTTLVAYLYMLLRSWHFIGTIYDNLFNDISIDTLAELTNRSLTSFKKEFKRLFNAPPHRWIIEQRLERARIMLASTSRTVSEIGIECGFANISHFIKLFKQRYNETPASFRQKCSAQAVKGYNSAAVV